MSRGDCMVALLDLFEDAPVAVKQEMYKQALRYLTDLNLAALTMDTVEGVQP